MLGAFGVRGVAKPFYRRSRNARVCKIGVLCFSDVSGLVFLIFVALETGLTSRRLSWGARNSTGGGGKSLETCRP